MIVWLRNMWIGLSVACCAGAGGGAAQPSLALTTAVQTSLAQQVARCWRLWPVAAGQSRSTVTVLFRLDASARVDVASLRLAGAGKGTSDAARLAYHYAKQALIRCGASGYELPLEYQGEMQSIEMTFNPERMVVR